MNIFEYTDLKQYLHDIYEFKKKQNSSFSYQYIAKKAGFENKGFVYNLFRGNKTLSLKNAKKLAIGIGLGGFEFDYFLELVTFSRVKTLRERNDSFARLTEITLKGNAKEPVLLRRSQYDLFSNWRHLIVRSLIGLYPFSGDFKSLAKLVVPEISVMDVKNSVRLLEQLELITLAEDGIYQLTDGNLSTGPEVLSLAIQNFHIDCTELARKAIINVSPQERNITGLALGISEKAYLKICNEIQNFQKKIIDLVNVDEDANRVYQLNFHFFPLSKKIEVSNE